MIELVQEGRYELAETATYTHVLTFDEGKFFAWVLAKGIGEILVSAKRHHIIIAVLARGEYRLFNVKDEVALHDGQHLELSVGDGWQGYSLPTGLPNGKIRCLIVPTWETISTEAVRMRRVRRAIKTNS